MTFDYGTVDVIRGLWIENWGPWNVTMQRGIRTGDRGM